MPYKKALKTKKRIILASGSRIRRQLLEGVGIQFQVINSNVDEDLIKKELHGRPFREQVIRLASEKARKVSMNNLENRNKMGGKTNGRRRPPQKRNYDDFTKNKTSISYLDIKRKYLHYKNGKLHTAVTFFKGANAYHVTKDGDSIHHETLTGLSLK